MIGPGDIATNLFEAGAFAGRLRKEQVLGHLPFRLIDVDTAVARTLPAVAARKPVAVFPFYAPPAAEVSAGTRPPPERHARRRP